MIDTRNSIDWHIKEAERLATYAELQEDNHQRHASVVARAQLHVSIAQAISLINTQGKTMVVRSVS